MSFLPLDTVDEPHTEPLAEPHSADGPVAAEKTDASAPISSDDLTALEQRVMRTVEVVRKERSARADAEAAHKAALEQVAQTEERAVLAESLYEEQGPVIQKLEQEITGLRSEREQIRLRVERVLSQLDALEL